MDSVRIVLTTSWSRRSCSVVAALLTALLIKASLQGADGDAPVGALSTDGSAGPGVTGTRQAAWSTGTGEPNAAGAGSISLTRTVSAPERTRLSTPAAPPGSRPRNRRSSR